MLVVDRISKSFNNKKVLDNISFTLNEGEVVSYLGTNGSGKTTTFRIIAGLLAADSGSVTYNKNLLSLKQISYLSEERSLFTDCTVRQQMKFICDLNEIDEAIIVKYLEEFQMENYIDTKIYKLSKGNQQKVALITVLLKDPTVVILDEPFTGLDNSNIQLFEKMIQKLKLNNKIIIVSSHIYQPINKICDRYIYLQNSKIALNITKKQIEENKHCVVEIQPDNDYLFNVKQLKAGVYLFDNYKQAKYLLKHLKEKYLFTIRKLNIQDYIEALNENIDIV